jgi:hypothetical protein
MAEVAAPHRRSAMAQGATRRTSSACPVPTNRAEEPCAIARGKRPCFCLRRLQKIVRVTGTQFVRSGPLCATSGTHWSNARRLIVFTARLAGLHKRREPVVTTADQC